LAHGLKVNFPPFWGGVRLLYKTTPKNNAKGSELVVRKAEEETDNEMVTRKNDNSGHKEKADDTENKNKWKLDTLILRCSDDEQKIKTEEFSVYIPQKASEIEHQQTAAVESSVLVEKTLNRSDPGLGQKNRTSLMNTILQELRQKTKSIKSRLDNI
jgi:hypothetical protein